MNEMTELATRFRNAWAGLSPEARGRIEPLVQASHDQLLDVLHERTPQPNPNAARELVFAQSVLNFNQDSILSRVNEIAKAIVDPNGEIWGPGKFQRLDRGWLEAGVIWLEAIAQPS